MSVFIVFAITVGPPRIGVAATIGLVIAGNLLSAAVIDRYGLFGQDVIPIDRWRLLGLLLLAVGAAPHALANVSAVVRAAARALVLDPDGRTASRPVRQPRDGRGIFWTTPGGGIDPANQSPEAVRRELLEETGLRGRDRAGDLDAAGGLRLGGEDPRPARAVRPRPDAAVRANSGDRPQRTPRGGRPRAALVDLAELESSDAVVYPSRLAHFLRQLRRPVRPTNRSTSGSRISAIAKGLLALPPSPCGPLAAPSTSDSRSSQSAVITDSLSPRTTNRDALRRCSS